MTTFKELGEKQLVEKIKEIIVTENYPTNLESDSAVLDFNDNKIAITSDILTFDRHKHELMTYTEFGWMCAATNISDLAATGATPKGLLVSLSLPLDMEVEHIFQLMMGIKNCTDFYNCHIVGGDTKPGTGTVSITAIGTMENRVPMNHCNAQVGDLIAVVGSLGGAAAGYYSLEGGKREDVALQLFLPIPCVDEGIALSSTNLITSCIDLSDGLGTAINTICSASKVGAIVEWGLLPIDENAYNISKNLNISLEKMALYWGGEYGLVFTFSKKDLEKLRELDVDFEIIGYITEKDCQLHTEKGYEELKYGCY